MKMQRETITLRNCNDLILRILALRNNQHPCFLEWLEFWIDRSTAELWSVCESEDAGVEELTLSELLADHSEKQLILTDSHRARICQQVAVALEHLHTFGVHGDFNSGDVIIRRDGGVKLKSLGDALHAEEPRDSRLPYYLAPEVIRGSPRGAPGDVWSFGVMIFELLTNEPPYIEFPPLRALFLITTKGLPPLPNLAGVNPDLVNLYNQCVVTDPLARPTAATLLSHPFLHDNNCSSLADFSSYVETSMKK